MIFRVASFAETVFIVCFKVECGDIVENESHAITILLSDKVKSDLSQFTFVQSIKETVDLVFGQ